jgi:hypothetical protein
MKTRYLKDGTPIIRNAKRICGSNCPQINTYDIPLKNGVRQRACVCRHFNIHLFGNQFGEPIQTDKCRKEEAK